MLTKSHGNVMVLDPMKALMMQLYAGYRLIFRTITTLQLNDVLFALV